MENEGVAPKSSEKELKDQFYAYYVGEISLRDFETWLYEHPKIETDIGEAFYFDLIDIDYRDKHAADKLEKVVYSRFPRAEFETRRIRELLEKTASGEDLPDMVQRLYDEYCRGYWFLEELGLAWVHHFLMAEHLSDKKIREKIARDAENIARDARRVLARMDRKEVVITGLYEYEEKAGGGDLAEGGRE
jgi:hypothetical protein